jgi:hypothetical protein
MLWTITLGCLAARLISRGNLQRYEKRSSSPRGPPGSIGSRTGPSTEPTHVSPQTTPQRWLRRFRLRSGCNMSGAAIGLPC